MSERLSGSERLEIRAANLGQWQWEVCLVDGLVTWPVRLFTTRHEAVEFIRKHNNERGKQ